MGGNLDYKWYGTDYGGFYICNDILRYSIKKNQQIIIYSAGIGEDISFDEAMLKEFNCKIFAFDPTPKSINWIQKQKKHDNFFFYPYGLSDKTEEKCFYLPKNKNYVSGSIIIHEDITLDDKVAVQMKSIEDIAKEYQHTYIDILKMDIEGSEFSVIENLPKNIVFGQIVVEFHERFFPNSKTVLKKAISQLRKRNYYCFAVSKHGDEYSFINKKEYNKRKCGKKK